jgi:hypothetical protein
MEFHTNALALLALPFMVMAQAASADTRQRSEIVFCCSADNDLYRVLTAAGATCTRHDRPMDAVASASKGAAVLILADGHPEKTTEVEPAVFDEAVRKQLRLFLEYPSQLPDLSVGPPREIKNERGVVISDLFGAALPAMRIVTLNGGHYVPVDIRNPHMALAKVAGVDMAVFGLHWESSKASARRSAPTEASRCITPYAMIARPKSPC